MRIAHVQPYDHLVAGGVRAHVINLAGQHKALGHDVTIVAPAPTDDGLPPEVARVSGSILPIRAAQSVARIPLSPAVVPQVGRVLRRGDFDVIHIHEPLCPMVGIA
jgi:phosphatidyl-myo-inositol alpha-mannosyltransferase